MHRRCLLLLVLSAACTPVANRPATMVTDRDRDRAGIIAEINAQVECARTAWEARDARIIFPDTSDTVVVRTPDGREVTRQQVIASIQQRMNITTRIDTMRTVVDSVRFDSRDEAVAYSSQLFVRELTVPGQPARVRASTVVHRQRFVRRDGRWEAAGPVEELNPRAWWADELPGQPPR